MDCVGLPSANAPGLGPSCPSSQREPGWNSDQDSSGQLREYVRLFDPNAHMGEADIRSRARALQDMTLDIWFHLRTRLAAPWIHCGCSCRAILAAGTINGAAVTSSITSGLYARWGSLHRDPCASAIQERLELDGELAAFKIECVTTASIGLGH